MTLQGGDVARRGGLGLHEVDADDARAAGVDPRQQIGDARSRPRPAAELVELRRPR
jgi:hypothetical protein